MKLFNTIFTYLFLLLLTTLVSCNPESESFYQTDLALSPDLVKLSIEESPEGSESFNSNISIGCGEDKKVFAILRNISTDEFLASMEVSWTLSNSNLKIEEPLSSEANLNAIKTGSSILHALYTDGESYELTSDINITVTGTCVNPFIPEISYDFNENVELINGRISKIFNTSDSREYLKPSNTLQGPKLLEENGLKYAEFTGSETLISLNDVNVSKAKDRVVIMVAAPYSFGAENYFPCMGGFGKLSQKPRKVNDLCFLDDRSYFVNFYGPDSGRDDTLDGSSPIASLNELAIYSFSYSDGIAKTFIDGELGNSVDTRIDTSKGKLILGSGVFNSYPYATNYQGRIYEVLIYEKGLSDSELDEVHQYIMSKYDL